MDKLEHGRVVNLIESKMKSLQKSPPVIDLPSKLELIKEISWLTDVSQDTIQEMSRMAEEKIVDKGMVIIKQGEVGENLFLIARGTATISVRREDSDEDEIISEIGVGQLIGELSWLTHKPRAATVRAASKGLIYAFNGAQMQELMDRDGTINVKRQTSVHAGSALTPPSPKSAATSPTSVPGSSSEAAQKERKKAEHQTKPKTVRHLLWQSAGGRVAENLLRYKDPYTSWDRAELRRWLLQWILFIPSPNTEEIQVVRPSVLLDGSAAQPWQVTTGEAYEAPYYLLPQEGSPMKLILGENCKIFCPPGAIRVVGGKSGHRKDSNIDDKALAAGGWQLIKQKMVDEKKGGWGKLAIDLRGAVEKEREQAAAAPKHRMSERRASTSYISDDMHNRLLIDEDELEERESEASIGSFARPSFGKSHTISDRGSLRSVQDRASSKRVVSPVSGGEDRESLAKRLSSGLTKAVDMESDTHSHLGKTSRARVMKELSFRNASEVDASANGPSLDSAMGMGTKDKSPAGRPQKHTMKPPAMLGLAAARLKRGAAKPGGSTRNGIATDKSSPKS